jgi:tetratricopeptide (TPR) repeat protein
MAFCAIAAATSASARSLWDDPAFALYQKAVEAINKKDYDAATRLAGEAIQQYPTHVLAYYLRGQAAIARSSWEAAAADLGKATELYPGSFAAQRDLGLAYQQLGRIDDAARAWQAAMALRPDDDDMRVRLAFMLLKADKEEPARALLKELAARDTRIPEVWTALGRLAYEENDLPATEQAFVRALALKDDGRTWFNLAVVRMRQDNRAGAMEAFERAAKHPETKEQAGKEIDKLRAGGTAERPAARGDVQQQPGVSTVQPARRGY